MDDSSDRAAGAGKPRRLFVYNGGFLAQRRLRRILALAGWQVRLGKPGAGDWVGVWGQSPYAARGERVAAATGAQLLRVEDAFLRSVRTGREGEAATGLLLDRQGVHFDASRPSDLEDILARAPLDDTALLDRARRAIEALRMSHLSKYNGFDPAAEPPDAPYVLVIDQTRGDASVRASGADAARFREMLVFALEENPGARIWIKTHPETAAGKREGHFGPEDCGPDVRLIDAPVSPWALMEGAVAVYTVSSQLGFEAILAGHRPRVFGTPFYAGWGLTQDEIALPRRTRRLTRAQLFAGAMILYPTWYDPYRDRLCELEDAMHGLAARARAAREDAAGYEAVGMRLWKRAHVRRFFGPGLRFARDEATARRRAARSGRLVMGWAGKLAPDSEALRVEDGFLRSRGLGAELVPPLSLVRDDLGIYYDPARPSRLEAMIAARATLPDHAAERARALIARLTGAGLTKYNLAAAAPPDLPVGRRILVAGQVEDDASIRLGCGEIRTNRALIEAARAAHPDAVILYKPHPDVEAGLRPGAIEAGDLADVVLPGTDPAALLEQVDAVWTLTSLIGFEALLRGRAVTCLGTPFYAGWGLTEDRGDIPARRGVAVSLEGLVHAALIDYPRYRDPVTGLPCPVEVICDRLEAGAVQAGGPGLRALSKLQGLFAGFAPLWR